MKHALIKNQRATGAFDPRMTDGVHEFPLTEAQREIWVSAVIAEEANAAFNISTHLKVSGPLNLASLQGAARTLMQRHSALRSRFSDDGMLFRTVEDCVPDWVFISAAIDESGDASEVVHEHAMEISEATFDLVNGPLLRIGIVRESDTCHHVIVVVHHIVSDGWSVRILLDELSSLYNSNIEGKDAELEDAGSYSQFALRNALIEDSDMKQAARRHWFSTLNGLEAPARLPPNLTPPSVRSYNADSIFRWMDDDVALQLRDLGRKHNASLFTTLFALYAIWVSRLSGDKDVVIGVPVAGQPYYAMPNLVGHCVNLLPYRYQIDSALSFEDTLSSVQARVADGYEHQTVTFGEVLKDLSIKRDASLVPLVPVTLNVVSAAGAAEFADCQSERLPMSKDYGTFELALDIYRDGTRLQLEAVFNRDLFTRSVMLNWLESFSTLAEFAVRNPSARIADMALVDARGFEQRPDVKNDTARDFDLTTPVAGLVERSAATHPDKTAVTAIDGGLSYREIDEMSNQVARYLSGLGETQGKIIGVLMERHAYLPAVLLGIHKCGAAYLPIDPVFPENRRAYMLEDSGATVVITESVFASEISAGVVAVDMNTALSSIRKESGSSLDYQIDPESRAYVIYTSGSTGNPKGVEISHRNMVNFLLAMQETPGMGEHDRLLAVTSLSFDISVLEIFLPLICAATVHIATSDQSADGMVIGSLIEERDINIMQATPSTWRVLNESGWTGRKNFRALCGGEPMPAELIPELLDRNCELWNMYGPTETTVWSSCAKMTGGDGAVSIGRPIANTTIHILDAADQVVPIGVSGEICIGGDGVAVGYLNRPELTAEKFFEYTSPTGQVERLYRTGDLGVIDEHGDLYHQGRLDFQVKLRGYRIELGEIEARLGEHPCIEQAIVDIWQVPNAEPVLMAYLRSVGDEQPAMSDIRSFLIESLPAYMIPQKTEWLSEFPLTPNGKVDRKKLEPADQVFDIADTADAELIGDSEKLLADIWQSTIGGGRPGRFDNFFEIGGHSLLAVRALGEVRSQTGVAVPMHIIVLEELRELAEFIDKNAPQRRQPLLGKIAGSLGRALRFGKS